MPKELFPLDTPYPVDSNRVLIEGMQRNLSSVVALFESLQGITGRIIERIETVENRIGIVPVSKPKPQKQATVLRLVKSQRRVYNEKQPAV